MKKQLTINVPTIFRDDVSKMYCKRNEHVRYNRIHKYFRRLSIRLHNKWKYNANRYITRKEYLKNNNKATEITVHSEISVRYNKCRKLNSCLKH